MFYFLISAVNEKANTLSLLRSNKDEQKKKKRKCESRFAE